MASSPVPAPPDVVQCSRDDQQTPWASFSRFTTPLAITFYFAALKLLLQLAAISGYGYYRDELYHFAESEHLSWGYVELPPMVPVLARVIRATLGDSLFATRIIPALAGVALVFLTALLVRQFGGGRFATWLACLCVTVCPIYLAWNHLLSPGAFELLFWMACVNVLVGIINGGSPKLWLLFGIWMGLGLENKHTMLGFGFALVVGLLFTEQRKQFANPWIWLGGLIALAIFLPNLMWQVHHGWPTLQFMLTRRSNFDYPVSTPLRFALQVAWLMNPFSFLVWLVGLMWLLFSARGAPYRALGIAFLATFVSFAVLKGKPYYVVSAFPMLYVAGAVAREDFIKAKPGRERMKTGVTTIVAVGGILGIPAVLPLLPIQASARYLEALHINQSMTETLRAGPINEYYADMLPWEGMTATVARVYHRLPPEDRSRTGILTANFAEAAAIDFFGRRYGLPKAMSGNLSYWLWGPHGFSGETLILVGENIQVAAANCHHLEKAGDFYHPYAMPYENGNVYLCRGLKEPLPVLWQRLKNWGAVH